MMYLKIIFKTILWAALFPTFAHSQEAISQDIKDKIFSSAIRIDYINSTGLGFYLGEGRILTAAHVVVGLHFPKSVPLYLVSASNAGIHLPSESFKIKIDPQTETFTTVNQFGYSELSLKNDVAVLHVTDPQIVQELNKQFSPISESMKSPIPAQIGEILFSVGSQREKGKGVFEILSSEVVMFKENEILLLPKQSRTFLPGDSGGAIFRVQNNRIEIVGLNAQVYGLEDKNTPLIVNSAKNILWSSTSSFANPLDEEWDRRSLIPGANSILQIPDETLIELTRMLMKFSEGQSLHFGSYFFKPVLEKYFLWSMPDNMVDDMVRVFRSSLSRTLDPTQPNLEYLRSRMLLVAEKYRGYSRGQCIHLFWKKRTLFEINSGII